MPAPVIILIVDDEDIVRKLIPLMLKGSENVVFLEATNATEGLKIAREHVGPIDLLLSDVVMPGGMDGSEMAALLSNTHPETKVCLMSGHGVESVIMEPQWRFIQKPFTTLEIRTRVGSILHDDYRAA
jgi:two-component system cell cycle sensor histidine kinase/response regulator CckA